MTCASCNTSNRDDARFCGWCGRRLPYWYLCADKWRALHSRSVAPPPVAPAITSKPSDVHVGQVLNNKYRVESVLGSGNIGRVYRGVCLVNNHKVALKVLDHAKQQDDVLVEQFLRQRHFVGRLCDPHTITLYEVELTVDGTLYLAMELLEGKSLRQVLREEWSLAWRRAFKIVLEMCSSLAEAHRMDIVHRNLKSENVYLERRPGNDEFVKVMDFKLARPVRGTARYETLSITSAAGLWYGPFHHMSPEQLYGRPLDGRSDIYALGVLAYALITGRHPFHDANRPDELISAQFQSAPVPPSQIDQCAMIPRVVDTVILKCLEVDKHNRYPDVTQLAAALQEAMMEPAP